MRLRGRPMSSLTEALPGYSLRLMPMHTPPSSPPSLAEHLAATPFTLLLGSGFFGFFAHLGMVQALEARGLRPRRMVGVSAGAIVAAAWASGTPLTALQDRLLSLRREDFWDPWPGLGLLRGQAFRRLLEETLSASTFEATRTPLAVTAVELFSGRLRVLESGDLPSAVHASCAVPLMFHPVRREGRLLIDGGVKERTGEAALAPGEHSFYHHLASRSPWRRAKSPSLAIPRREGLCTLVIEGLPRPGPYRLAEGARALEAARAATERALDLPNTPTRPVITVPADG